MRGSHARQRGQKCLAGILAVLSLAAAACQYNPVEASSNELMHSCEGEVGTLGIGFDAATDPPEGATYQGTEGRDIVIVLNGPVTFDGLGGDDLVCVVDVGDTAAGMAATIHLGDGDDRLMSSSPISLHVDGGEGADVITTGAGDDVVDGGTGIDTIDAGAGDDVVTGGDAADTLRGGPGADVISGGAGNDQLMGDDGIDEIDGGAGDDRITGGAGTDDLVGGDGEDQLSGDDGDDALAGDAGDDTLIGGPDDDDCDGGSGDEVDGDSSHSCEATTAIEHENLQIVSPSNGETVFGSASVVIDHEVLPDVIAFEISVGGDVEATITPNGTSAILDLTDRPEGTTTIVAEGVDDQGTVVASTQVDVVLEQPTAPDLSADLLQRRQAGTITADEYLVSGFLATSTANLPADDHEGEQLGHLLSAWDQATRDGRQAILDQHRVTEAPGPNVTPIRPTGVLPPFVPDGSGGAEVGGGQAACPLTKPMTWVAGLFIDQRFCAYAFGPESFANQEDLPGELDDLDDLTDLTWFVEPSYDLTDNDGDNVPDKLVNATYEVWGAELLFEERGLSLPEAHRDDGVPLHFFVMNNDRPAYSSPFDERDGERLRIGIPGTGTRYGHPIRLSGPKGHLSQTVVHELFHTFEWNTIDWGQDVSLSGNPGRTVALYESGANWGAQEYSSANGEGWGYNASRVATEWLDEPGKAFMSYPDGIYAAAVTGPSAYAYFPALEWLDEHGGGGGTVGSSGLVRDVFVSYDDHWHGADPIDLIEDEIDGGQWAAANGEERLARAWPRMWAALYALDGTGGSAFDNDEFRWMRFWDSEPGAWRTALNQAPTAGDGTFAWNRPARLDATMPLTDVNFPYIGDSFVLEGGGAGFQDYTLPANKRGAVRFEVDPLDGDDQYEAFAIVWKDQSGGSEVCIGSDGRPVVVVSDGARQPDGSIGLDVPYNEHCSRATVGAVHVTPNSIVSDRYVMKATLLSAEDPPPIPVNITAPTIVKSTYFDRPTMTLGHPGTWSSPPGSYTHRWMRCDGAGAGCTPVQNEWSSCYPNRYPEIGATMRLELTAIGPGGRGTSVLTNALTVEEADFALLDAPEEPLLFDETGPPTLPGQRTLVTKNPDGSPYLQGAYTAHVSGNGRVAYGSSVGLQSAWSTEDQQRIGYANLGYPAFSANGRYIAGATPTSNNMIAVSDLSCGGYQTLTVDPGTGAPPSGWYHAAYPRMSSDGRFIVFAIHDQGGLAGEDFGEYRSNVFRFDRSTGSLDLVSTTGGGAADGDSGTPDVSDDGRFVAFWTAAPELGADPSTGGNQVVVRDMETGAVNVVSTDVEARSEDTYLEGGPANNNHGQGPIHISNDGNYVSYMARGRFFDGGTGFNGQPTTRSEQRLYRASRSGGGSILVNSDPVTHPGFEASMSGDGNWIAFKSYAALTAEDPDVECDVFLTQVGSGSYSKVSVEADGADGCSVSRPPEISDDGRFVVSTQHTDDLPTDQNGNWTEGLWIFDRDS